MASATPTDNNGNTTGKTDASGTTQYSRDYENRLTSVNLAGGGTVTFKYDPFGRRIQKSGPSGTTNYVYDGANIAAEVDNTGAALAHYAQDLGIDEPLAMQRSGALSFYSADGLGSMTSLTTGTGAVADTFRYDTFGNLASSTGNIVNPYRYTAREYDEDSGLNYYRARYYDSQVGRFISEDPIKFDGGISFYAYVQNNPANLIDPTGLAPGCGCADVPEIPPSVNLLDNVRRAERSKWLIFAAPRLYWFYQQVRNHGPWDYKQTTTYDSGGINYQDFGNFNFGMTGAAAGIELQVLLRGAGWAQEQAGTSTPEWGHWYGGPPYGDDPADQAEIIAGFNYYKNGCYK